MLTAQLNTMNETYPDNLISYTIFFQNSSVLTLHIY